MSFGLCNWFVKEEYEKCKASKEIDAATAREMAVFEAENAHNEVNKNLTIYKGENKRD